MKALGLMKTPFIKIRTKNSCESNSTLHEEDMTTEEVEFAKEIVALVDDRLSAGFEERDKLIRKCKHPSFNLLRYEIRKNCIHLVVIR